VLNQSYEPVTICSPKKAIVLLVLMKAELVAHKSNRIIRTINYNFPYPSVIRLNRFVKMPFKKVELSRKNIMRRDNLSCQYCGSGFRLTIDHVYPKSRGGNDTWENLVTACVSCNNVKGNRTPEEADMPLRTIPKKPHHILYLRQFFGKVDDTWRPFLFLG